MNDPLHELAALAVVTELRISFSSMIAAFVRGKTALTPGECWALEVLAQRHFYDLQRGMTMPDFSDDVRLSIRDGMVEASEVLAALQLLQPREMN